MAAAVAALLAAGCGSVENPDLGTGTVTGRISGASPGAYAYVLGAPSVHAPIASDGSFRLDRVPAGERKIVLFDGSAGAGAVDVEVEGASIANLPDPGSLPPACAILVAAGLGGAKPTGLSFSVDGALLRAADGTLVTSVPGPAAALFPLPAGDWTLRAGQPGYRESATAIYKLTGGASWPVDVTLDVESASDRRGCVSSGCEPSLACEAGDGYCYECVSDGDCTSVAGSHCTDHVCVRPPPAGGLAMCQACSLVADCGAGPGGEAPACVVAAGAAVGYCSYDCSTAPAGYPSGYRCDNVPPGVPGNPSKAWIAPASCLALYTTYGASCATDDACKVALDGGKCWPLSGTPRSTAGACSGRCTANADCPAWLVAVGWTCDTAGTHYCRPP
jgi:hypothetical protein